LQTEFNEIFSVRRLFLSNMLWFDIFIMKIGGGKAWCL